MGLNLTRFDSEFRDRVYSEHIDEDIQRGKNSGVKSTPTFFINCEFYNGGWDLDRLLGAPDEESVFGWSEANR